MYEIKTGEYTPDNFFRGFFPAVPEHGTVKDGATVRKYAPVAETGGRNRGSHGGNAG